VAIKLDNPAAVKSSLLAAVNAAHEGQPAYYRFWDAWVVVVAKREVKIKNRLIARKGHTYLCNGTSRLFSIRGTMQSVTLIYAPENRSGEMTAVLAKDFLATE